MKKVLAVLLMAVVLVGCSGGASETKPIADVQKEAQTMDVDKLTVMVESYQAAIESKKGEIAKVQAKLKEIPVTELLGEDAKALKGDLSDISASVKALTERMKIYASEAKK